MNRLSKRHLIIMVSLLLGLATLTVYWPVQHHDFINYDDNLYIYENAWVLDGITIEGLQKAFFEFHVGNWHPLTWVSHMLDTEIYWLNAGGHHWTSVELHILNTILLFLVLFLMSNAPWCSALVSVLFALHPLHVESVSWVSERKDILCAFFWFLTLGAYVFYTRKTDPKRYCIVILFFLLGLLSKPMGVTLPFVLLLLDYWPLSRYHGTATVFDRCYANKDWGVTAAWVRLLLEKVPLMLLSAASCLITLAAQQSINAVAGLEHIPLDARLGNSVITFVVYIRQMIWPVDLIVFYPHAGLPPPWQIVGAILLLGGVTVACLRGAKRYPFLIVGWLWYLGTLVPVIGIIQVGFQASADRYTYIPLIGLFIMAAWGMREAVERSRTMRPLFAVVLPPVLIAMMMATHVQVKTWENSFTVFGHALSVSERNFAAHNNIGSAYLRAGRCDLAVPHFLTALEIDRENLNAHYNLGVCAYRNGDYDEATNLFRRTVEIDRQCTRGWVSLGLTLMQGQRFHEAGKAFRTVLDSYPDHELARHQLAVIDRAKGGQAGEEASQGKLVRKIPPQP